MRCEKCKGVLATMRGVFKEEGQNGVVTFINVPVSGCVECGDDLVYSFRDGLIIEHYTKHHGKEGEEVNFEEIESSYNKISIPELIGFVNSKIQ